LKSKKQRAKGKKLGAEVATISCVNPNLPFAFCLLPFAFQKGGIETLQHAHRVANRILLV